MKKRTIICISCTALLLLLTGLLLWLFLPASVPVDNERPLAEIQKNDCYIENMLMAEAIFNVRDGFGDVDAQELAREADIKLECRRQISPTEFYYVVGYGTYRCFIFTDENNIVRHVLYCSSFQTTAEVQKEIKLCNAHSWDSHESCEYGLAKIGIELGNLTRGWKRQYILADGVLIIETPFAIAEGETKYHFYTDEEWETARKEWGGYTILPIDKQNQPIKASKDIFATERACQNADTRAVTDGNTAEESSITVNKETAETCSAEQHQEMIDAQKERMLASLQAHGSEMEQIALEIIAQNRNGIYSSYRTDTKYLQQKEKQTDYVPVTGTELNQLLDSGVDSDVFSFICATPESDNFQNGCCFFSDLTDSCDILFCRLALVYTEEAPTETEYFHPEQIAPCWYYVKQWLGY